ncbi:Oxr1p KNAG_0D05130 [Huiozyma naganishii CBS 8797]|uniref:Oxidation resistance protein 1 n=1 Tax=Huiozyma naganishii (strain ATCC MYA-139 / BCRC 22969 / CBS 8797 / KCTC 17520 / NBRC 10181 / NCYC 3082 / Yp74L-3) TaxID=1071383 RepID=J7RYK6_HUIN7|nr:hypothetical protein KNAG_0D05130 [Kazachstania naganishii CBS 8797]CCK70252.1 hypothetical protein KNAG_0D05130 [Kazachstania naganishii CBS 8797]
MGVRNTLYRLKRTFTGSVPTQDQSEDWLPTNGDAGADADEDETYRLPLDLEGYSVTTKNRLLDTDIANELRALMPPRIQLYTRWGLVYSLEQHGASLHSLYACLKDARDKVPKGKRCGYVLVIRDRLQSVFGGTAMNLGSPRNIARTGERECFLWSVQRVQPKVLRGQEHNMEGGMGWQFRGFPFTGENEFAMYCTSQFLSMGAGDGLYGLWCDDALFHGVSYRCDTYGNDPLSAEGEKFHITGLEVWQVGCCPDF